MADLEDDDEWEVEEIKEEKRIKRSNYFLVKWAGWPSEYNQWVPEEDLENVRDTIKDFRKAKSKKTKTKQPPKSSH
ncbi:uncharacterized protein N7515_000205 [Penicillium bovifimosum]|uniref:Chromo domain-containing protein n=1 Tax=Penicillium bovifimosum TaxID=126998 RepID=A0A9W9HEJ3_9EURO|nr:uncharacterized protein N7515_000205 [Penicillium bovifimosum]KAJ5145641.1 hypothetical protein N7515_000205 [Penicillium bovifimosum]